MSQKPLWDQYRRQQSLCLRTANCTETSKMNLHLSSLVLIWLLTSCGAVTTEQNDSLTTPKGRVATQEAPTSGPRLLPDPTTDVQRSAQTPTPAVQTGAAATFPLLPELSDSTRAENATTGQQADVSMQPGTPATAAATPMETSSSTSIPTTLPPSTSIPTTLPPSTSIPTTLPPGTTASMSTQPTLITDVQPTAPSQTTPATTKRTLEDIIRPEKDGGRPKKEATKEANHSTVVAWVIGATLALMMVSFLVIYIRKRKLNEQQITIKNWAGPSPFIEDGEDNGQIRQRSSNRISLSSFLPQSLSRKLSLLPETDEEMEDVNPGTTFGDRREGAPSDQQGAGRDVEGRTGAAADAPEAKTTNGVAEKETCVRAASPTTTVGDLMAVSLTDDFPANGVGETAQG